MSVFEKLAVIDHKAQGSYHRVLCVCSAGILRSPTAALVLSHEPFNYNTRCAGLEQYALIPVTGVLIAWAHEIVVMEPEHARKLLHRYAPLDKPVRILHIPDDFEYREGVLMDLIASRYREAQ